MSGAIVTIRRRYHGALVSLVAFGVAWAQPQSPLVSIALDKDTVKVEAGAEFSIVVQALIAPGWHINSNLPNDESLIPVRIDAEGKSVRLIGVEYPKPADITLSISETPLSMFEGNCRFTLTFNTGHTERSHTEAIPIILHYQACNDRICTPPASVKTTLFVDIAPQARRKTHRGSSPREE